MAFLQHQPTRRSNNGGRQDEEQKEQWEKSVNEDKDWNIVFPGRAKTNLDRTQSRPHTATATTSESLPSPFVESPTDEELELDLTLPPAHDGTGRFTRPSSPSYYIADDESDNPTHSPESALVWGTRGEDVIASLESVSSDDELDLLEEAEVSSSVLISDSESGNVTRTRSNNRGVSSIQQRKGSTSISAQKLQRASQLDQYGSSTLASSSWSWMNAAQSQQQQSIIHPVATTESWNEVILTSDSEAEEEPIQKNARKVAQLRKLKEEEAFEEALALAPSAHSAGLHSRHPKRRHRKNGESEKGSKRSNNSAAVTSELLSAASRRRTTRKSQTSATTSAGRSKSQLGAGHRSRRDHQDSNNLTINNHNQSDQSSRTERLLNAILKRIFNIDDDDVLQAFIHDRGPLAVDDSEKERCTNAAIASRAPLSFGSGTGVDDEIWSRNQRQRHVRLLLDGRSVPEEVEEVESENEEDDKRKEYHSRSNDHSRYPTRSYVSKNVSEPSLPEALHATLLSGLRSVPSGLSILLAGSNSVRFVNYLVGRIGPGLTDRMRKLVDEASSVTTDETNLAIDENDDSTSNNDLITRVLRSSSYSGSLSDEMGSWDGIDISSLRFKGENHPAIASSSNRSTRSSSQSTVPATNY